MYLVSACLAGINCRYDGKGTKNSTIAELVKSGKALALCPEVLGGLSIPRDRCEILVTSEGKKIVINEANNEFTEAFIKGAQKTLEIAKILGIEIAILKSKSPSCGSGLIYDGEFSGTLGSGNGIAADLLIKEGIKVYTEESFMRFLKEKM